MHLVGWLNKLFWNLQISLLIILCCLKYRQSQFIQLHICFLSVVIDCVRSVYCYNERDAYTMNTSSIQVKAHNRRCITLIKGFPNETLIKYVTTTSDLWKGFFYSSISFFLFLVERSCYGMNMTYGWLHALWTDLNKLHYKLNYC